MKKLYDSLEMKIIQITEEVVRTSSPVVNEDGSFDGMPESFWN